MSELDQDPAVSRNLHRNRGETQELYPVFGPRGTDSLLMSVSQIRRQEQSPEPHQGLGSSRKEKKKYRHCSSNVVLSLRPWSPPTNRQQAKTFEEAILLWLISVLEVCSYVASNARMSIAT
jgi:hypothetical protein